MIKAEYLRLKELPIYVNSTIEAERQAIRNEYKKFSDALTQGVIKIDEYTDLGHQKVQ